MYNSEKTIEQVLGSVISQTAISEIAEIIVVDERIHRLVRSLG